MLEFTISFLAISVMRYIYYIILYVSLIDKWDSNNSIVKIAQFKDFQCIKQIRRPLPTMFFICHIFSIGQLEVCVMC